MKRTIKFIGTLSILFLTLMFRMSVEAKEVWCTVEGVVGGQIKIDSETGIITDCETSVIQANIPAEIDGIKIIGIGDSAFEQCSDLNNVTIPEGVTNIGKAAFSRCLSLEYIEISKSVKKIEDYAFNDCRNLKSVEIPEGVESLENRVFLECDNLENVIIHKGIKKIGDGAFYGCLNLRRVEIPEGVEILGDEVFCDCINLTTVIISEVIEEIGGYIFSGCSSLESIELPEGITSIGNGEFSGCSSLESIELPEGITSIGDAAFSGCSSLESIELPEGITNIGDATFGGCSSLESIELPEGITSIGKSAFSSCNSLKNVILPKGVTSIGESAFSSCNSLENVILPEGVINIGIHAFSYCRSLKTIEIPDNVTSIGAYAFMECESLISVKIPMGIEIIKNSLFENCSSLTEVTIPAGVECIEYCAFMGCESLICVIIPEGVTEIEAFAFEGCKSLKNVELPEGIFKIEDRMFKACENLACVKIPDSVISIGESAFSGCISLKNLKIPDSVISIGESAFSDCSSLENIVIPEKVSIMGKNIFTGCDKLKTLGPINSGCNIEYRWKMNIPSGSFFNCENLTEVIVADGIECIEEKAFYGCTGLKKLILSKTVKIGTGAFRGCSNLEVVEIPEGVTTVETFAFFACSNLEKLIIPSSLETIGTYAFGSCPKLCSAGAVGSDCNIEYGWETQIPEKAFYMLSSLVQVTIPEGITEIGDKAFQGCSLNSVKIPNSLKDISAFNDMKELISAGPIGSGCNIEYSWTEQIPENAFANFSLLTKVVLSKTITVIGENAFCNCEKLTVAGPVGSGSAIEYQWKKTIPTGFGSSLKTVILGTEITQVTAEILSCDRLVVYNSELSSFDFVDTDTVTVISGFSGSTAESYARGNQITFEPLHPIEYVQIREESCENVGIKRAAWYCEECDKYYTENYHVNELSKDTVEIPALGHNYQEEVTEPTCVKDGNIVYTCLTCGHSYTEETEALGHSYKEVVIKPTCETEGYTVHTCIRCKSGYVDNETEALGHSYKEVVIEPTCEDGGYTTHICSRCKDSYVDNEIEALGHSYKSVVTEPICEEGGYTTHTCSTCGHSYVDNEKKALGHSYKLVVTEPTCEEGGYTTHTCSTCGHSYIDEETAALGHSYKSVVTKPTCEEGGYTTHTCSTCGHRYVDNEKKALGHSYKSVVTEPTCEEGGYTTYTCSRCQESYVDNETEALGHSFTNYVSDNNAVPGAAGTKTAKCDRCDATDTIEDPDSYIPKVEGVVRLSGTSRYETGYKVANALKERLGVDKFDAVIIATGQNFADALAGSYLSACKDAPILLTNGKIDNILQLHDYIRENVNAGGTIYILGGESAVPKEMELISGYQICRLEGASRYDTNIAILNEAGIDGEELIVATGKTFADSLSASAAKLPILLVKPDASLSEEQKAILREVSGGTIYIIGGEGAVSGEIERELAKYAYVERISGATRYETSVKVAETFFGEIQEVVLASGKNFPDGLCGGALAAAMDAPLILTTDGKTYDAAGYLQKEEVTSGYVLGGSGALSDESVVDVFKLVSAEDIIQK